MKGIDVGCRSQTNDNVTMQDARTILSDSTTELPNELRRRTLVSVVDGLAKWFDERL